MLHSASNRFIFTSILLLSINFIEIICLEKHALEIIPERVEVTYENEKYVKNIKTTVRRNGRKSPYVIHIEGDLQEGFGNNVSLSIILYEYHHNEYKRSFVEFHFKFCDFINKDDFVGSRVRMTGIKCPLSKGHWNISNVRLDFPNFPYVFPFKRAKSEVSAKVSATEEVIASGNFYILVKQK